MIKDFNPSDMDSFMTMTSLSASERFATKKTKSLAASTRFNSKEEKVIEADKQVEAEQKPIIAANCAGRWSSWFAKYLAKGKTMDDCKKAAYDHLETYDDEAKKNEAKQCVDKVVEKVNSLGSNLAKTEDEIYKQLSTEATTAECGVQECDAVEGSEQPTDSDEEGKVTLSGFRKFVEWFDKLEGKNQDKILEVLHHHSKNN